MLKCGCEEWQIYCGKALIGNKLSKYRKEKKKKPLSSWYKEYVVKSTVQVMSKGRGEKVQQTTSLGD